MDFFKECKEDSSRTSPTSNKVDTVLRMLSKEESESLLKALRDSSISSRSISRVLINNKFSVGRWAVNEWRVRNGVEIISHKTTVKADK